MTFQLLIDNTEQAIHHKLIYYLSRENAYTDSNRTFMLDDIIVVEKKPQLFSYPCDPVHIEFEGSPITVEYSQSRTPKNFQTRVVRFDRITLHSEKSIQHINDFVDMLHKLQIPISYTEDLNLYHWVEHSWMYSRHYTQRKLDTIYLQQRDYVVETLTKFLHDADQAVMYQSLGVPNKFICMFHGQPGTGKTSLIRALASHFGYHLCMVKHAQDMDDNTLERMLSRLKDKSFLVFEDIDCIFDQRDVRAKNNISYSGILNMLDGIGSYEKLVVFITTNRLPQLDAAFKRRVDLFIEFTCVQKSETIEMYARFFPQAPLSEAVDFWNAIRQKSLTINMLEKHFMYCLRKGIRPLEDLLYLEEYSDLTQEKTYNQLYS